VEVVTARVHAILKAPVEKKIGGSGLWDQEWLPMLRIRALKQSLRIVGNQFRSLSQRLYSTTEIRMYAMRSDHACIATASSIIRRDVWADLEQFDERASWTSRDRFLSEARKRLEAGEHFYAVVDDARLVHFGWMVAPVERRSILEVGQTAAFPPSSAYAYDFFTHPAYRNRGLYQASLRQVVFDVHRAFGLREIYIGVDSKNIPSHYVIQKVGFAYRYSLFQKWRWNCVERWRSEES
jgi:RimJ/RimL family protein N-acetyltransferase